MTLGSRIGSFRNRQGGRLIRGLLREGAVRLWVRLRLWRIIGPVSPSRQPQRWVFMGGCYNSGTTILREILGAHPEIATLPREGVRLTSAFPDLSADGWQRMWYRHAEKTELQGVDLRMLAHQARKDWAIWWARGKPVFLEKSIVHGAWMPKLQEGFGECRFIGVIRNGFCAAEGIRRRAHPSGQAARELGRDHYTIADAARQWVFANERLARDRYRVTCYHEIRYEDFVDDPAAVLTALFRFIGVDETAFTCRNGTIEIGGRRFIIRNDNPSSIGRLTAEDRAAFLEVAGSTMRDLGYDPDGQP